MKKVIYIVVGIAVIGLIAYTLTNNKKKNEAETEQISKTNDAIAVRIDTVSSQVPNVDYVANGTFAPSQELSFPAENSGRVVKVLVDEGDRVRIGQVLAVIKGDQLNIQLSNAKAAYENAKSDAQRYANAFKTGGVTQQQVDQAKLSLTNAKAQYDQTKISLGDASIKASINGIVNVRNIEPGSVVAPGTVLFELVNVSTLKLKVNVDEQHVAGLKIGSPIKVTASVYPDKEFNGKVTFIAPKADGSLNFPVEVEIANDAASELKAGMYGTANFSGGGAKPQPVKTISRNAFVGGVAGNQVFVVKDGTVKLVKIVSGRVFGDEVEVLSGLNEGETVVISGQINLTDGAKVSIIK
jgi:RND family efflux transporter MFP subunit